MGRVPASAFGLVFLAGESPTSSGAACRLQWGLSRHDRAGFARMDGPRDVSRAWIWGRAADSTLAQEGFPRGLSDCACRPFSVPKAVRFLEGHPARGAFSS